MVIDAAANAIKDHAEDGLKKHGAFADLAAAGLALYRRAEVATATISAGGTDRDTAAALRRVAQAGGIAMRALQQFAHDDDDDIARIKHSNHCITCGAELE